MVDLVAYLDESKRPLRDLSTGKPSTRGDHYVVAAAVVIEGEVSAIQEAVVDVEARLGYRLHYSDLRSRERRLAALAALDEIPGWDAYLFETAKPLSARRYSEHHIRAKTMESAFLFLGVDIGVTKIVPETRAAPRRGFTRLDENDRGVWQSLVTTRQLPASVRLEHADKTEPLLSIADLVAGSRSAFLCLIDQEPYPLIAHRVRGTVRLFEETP